MLLGRYHDWIVFGDTGLFSASDEGCDGALPCKTRNGVLSRRRRKGRRHPWRDRE